MNAQQYITKMKQFQEDLLEYFSNDKNPENVVLFMKDQFQQNQMDEIKATLKLILEIVNNHLRKPCFFTKIKNLLVNFKKEFQQIFSNYELFDFFKSSKLLLLFFIKESLLTIDQTIALIMNENEYWTSNYIKFFLPESRPFISEALYNEIQEDIIKSGFQSFEENRMIGENEQHICHLIRNDLIDDFIIFINETNFQLSTIIKQSVFETNLFLNQNNPSLIEYSAFYGSIQIFKYLNLNGIQLTPSLWIYAIHGKNPEILQFLEDNKVFPEDRSFDKCLNESVKCYSNDVANYIINQSNRNDVIPLSFLYHNYYFFDTDNLENTLYYSCKYNYIHLVDLILKSADIDINKCMILK